FYTRTALMSEPAAVTLSVNEGEAAHLTPALTPPAAPAPAEAKPTPTMPPADVQLAILRETLLAVDQGMKTGNFTVLRDPGRDKFRKANTAAKLAQIFGALSAQGIDLMPIAVADPSYATPPALTDKQMLRMSGVFPIQPRQAAFDVLLEMEDGGWRLYGVSV